MTGYVSFVPASLRLDLYAGDGAALNITVEEPDGDPYALDGTVTAMIRDHRADEEARTEFDVTLDGNVATLVLTGTQPRSSASSTAPGTASSSPSVEPVTLVLGQARSPWT